MTDPQDVLVTDVTLRDGGYLNGHSWTPASRGRIVAAVAAAGADRIEVGYLDGAGPDAVGHAGITVDALKELAGQEPSAHLVVMARRSEKRPDFEAAAAAGVRTVRLPAGPDDPGPLAETVARARDAGLRTVVNLIRTSRATPDALRRAAARTAAFGADELCVADSNGSLLPGSVGRMVRSLRREVTLPIGIHTHDNLSLAFANALAALAAGASCVDASCRGIGKGGGNLALEVLAAYLHGLGRSGLDPAALEPAAAVLTGETETRNRQANAARVAALSDLDYDQAQELHGLNDVEARRLLATARSHETDTIWAAQRAHSPFGD